VDNLGFERKLLRALVADGTFADDPFVLVDVGCGLGIDPAWREFGGDLRALGIDPQLAEIERLRQAEKHPGISYHTAFVGLADDHPVRLRRRERLVEESYFQPFGRTSASYAIDRALTTGGASFEETNAWTGERLAAQTVGLADLLQGEGVTEVDFVKTDTDGGDLDVLLSFESMIESAQPLGFMVETYYTGSADESASTYHNVDRLLKRFGFSVYAMSVNRYSRAVLPAQFTYSILAQTVRGQPQWGDLVYLRDAAHPDYGRFGELRPTKLLKLACLYELFDVPDCAAELLLFHRDALSPLVDVDRLLDLLTPPLRGRPVTYREYVAAFEADPTLFYPEPEPQEELPPPAPPTLLQRVKHVVARALGRVQSVEDGADVVPPGVAGDGPLSSAPAESRTKSRVGDEVA
jgi:FkbM family methyltransferase